MNPEKNVEPEADPRGLGPAGAALIGQELLGVTYYHVPSSGHEAGADDPLSFDIVDHGLDLILSRGTVGVTWAVNPSEEGLILVDGGLRSVLGTASVIAEPAQTWQGVLGRRIRSVDVTMARAFSSGRPHPKSINLAFDGGRRFVVSASKYLRDDGVFIEFADEIVVVFDADEARRHGLID
ncbi:MAG: hypothetical protein H0U52_14630 [Chloroflexi bacterium]|nr:hypothetical protein [Chloroflexota bacterium]